MSWHGRLEGGPFDGDTGEVARPTEPPPKLWVLPCEGPGCRYDNCGGHAGVYVHWLIRPLAPGEIYRFDRDDDGVAIYVYAKLEIGGPVRSELATA